MSKLLWNSPKDLESLLYELVGWESETFSEGEKNFSIKLHEKMSHLPYFSEHADYLTLDPIDKGRSFLTALYKNEHASDTVVLISHFDTVETEEYGQLQPICRKPLQLTEALKQHKDRLSKNAVKDLESGEYVFGRGTMDMKIGLAIHMGLIEKAIAEEWPINLLLVTVPDEEVNSLGMRAAVKKLVNLSEEHGLVYQLFLNSESSFSQAPEDENYYIYTGTIGKIMPSALFYGKETHVGEPLKGMTANYIAAYFNQQMEWNPLFQEEHLGEKTPLPVSLQQKDLKLSYSTQTPARAQALYNVFIMQRSAKDIMDRFEQVAIDAVSRCNENYRALCKQENIQGIGDVRVLRFEKLESYARDKFGDPFVDAVHSKALQMDELDERDQSFFVADQLMHNCQELAPAVILLFTPPYYPAVNSSDDPLIQKAVQLLSEMIEQMDIPLKPVNYFNGICDLSYVNYTDQNDGWTSYEKNTPIWGDGYFIPFEDMKKLRAPVLNVGAFGKDAHQLSERLHKESAFVRTPVLVEKLILGLFGR